LIGVDFYQQAAPGVAGREKQGKGEGRG
jgi:hypothetical protein